MARLRHAVWLVACALGLSLACSGKTTTTGELMLAMNTDMSLPKDVDHVRIQIKVSGRVVYDDTYDVGPGDGKVKIPATLGVVAGNDVGAVVRIKVSALQNRKSRMLREVTTTVPIERIGLLRIPIQWISDGSAIDTPDGDVISTCPDGQTDIAGTCRDMSVLSAHLPSYTPADVFGGGREDGTGGSCFDTLPCFAGATPAHVDLTSCTLPAQSGDLTMVNVGLALALGDDGICDDAACYIGLDANGPAGWNFTGDPSLEGGGAAPLGGPIQLPTAICDKLKSGRVKSVVTSFACASKTEKVPTCGPWSSVGGGTTGSDAAVADATQDSPFDAAVADVTQEAPCVGLQCQQIVCPGGGKTTVSGKVYDPAGTIPLYNVVVYVPNSALAPIATGASCDKCGTVSGDPLATALSDASGSFVLENVPVGTNIPLVLQVGKWRRQVTIPAVAPCADTPLTDPALTRLPRNQAEGDMPQMAIATGNSDPFECLLRKMGIDDAEFTPNSGTGRVHYYRSNGIDLAPPAPAAATLWTDPIRLNNYDIVMLPCEGAELVKTAQATNNIVNYTSLGGRVFTTHYGYVWLATNFGAAPFPSTGQWLPGQVDSYATPLVTTVDTSFPKGAAFAQWLTIVGASTAPGTMTLIETRHDLTAVNNPPSQRWIYTPTGPGPNPSVLHMTFNTPVGMSAAQQCGRVVFSDFHVSASALSGSPNFPASCRVAPLTAQEKALEFMFFDLASCIQMDNEPPTPPR